MRKLVYLCKLVLAFNLGVLVACLLAGCTIQADVYWPGKDRLAARRVVHEKQPISFQDRLDMRAAYRADRGAE